MVINRNVGWPNLNLGGALTKSGNEIIDIKGELFDNRAFWNQQSPWYYTNYETSSWKKSSEASISLVFSRSFMPHILISIHSSKSKDLNSLIKMKTKSSTGTTGNGAIEIWWYSTISYPKTEEYGIADMKMLHFGKTRTLNQKKKFILDRRQSGKEQDTMTQKSKSVFQPKSVIRISLCRTAKRNPLIFPI